VDGNGTGLTILEHRRTAQKRANYFTKIKIKPLDNNSPSGTMGETSQQHLTKRKTKMTTETKNDMIERIAERYYIESLLAYMTGEYKTVWQACELHGFPQAEQEAAAYGYGFRESLDCAAIVLQLAKQDGHA